MVMDYLKGKTLSKILEERGTIPEREATAYIRQVGQALSIVHRAGLLHRDIKPDNIVITDDGRVVLIDFGSARGFAAGKTRRMTALLTPGYAPLEQYAEMAQRGPYTDVYALAATLYHLVTGQMPVQATDRAAGVELRPPRELNPHISRSLNDAIMWAMGMKVDERPQSVSEFLRALRQFVPIPRRQSQRPSPAPPAQPQPRQRRPPKPQPRPVPPPQPQWPDTLFQWPGPGTPVFDHCLSAFIGAFAGAIGGGYLTWASGGVLFGIVLGAMFGFVIGIALGKTFVYLLITGLMTYIGYWASPLIVRHLNFTSQYVPLIGIASGFLLGALISLAIDRKWRR
jgi:serine/threonine protein kinase